MLMGTPLLARKRAVQEDLSGIGDPTRTPCLHSGVSPRGFREPCLAAVSCIAAGVGRHSIPENRYASAGAVRIAGGPQEGRRCQTNGSLERTHPPSTGAWSRLLIVALLRLMTHADGGRRDL